MSPCGAGRIGALDAPSTEPLSKRALLRRFAAEEGIFLGYLARTVRESESRRDVFQDACLKFLSAPAVFHAWEPALKYFYRALRSVAFDNERRNRRMRYVAELPEMICEPLTEWHLRLDLERLMAAAALLPPLERAVVSPAASRKFGSLREESRALNLRV